MVDGKRPATCRLRRSHRVFFSGIDLVEVDRGQPPAAGRRAHQRDRLAQVQAADRRGEVEEAAEIAPRQVKAGRRSSTSAWPIPIATRWRTCREFLRTASRKVKVPLMIDSTDAGGVERALTYCQGKAIINSINLEDGEERFEQVGPAGAPFRRRARGRHASTRIPSRAWRSRRERKLEVARRCHELLDREVRRARPRTSSSIRWSFPAPPATRTMSAARWRPSRGCA